MSEKEKKSEKRKRFKLNAKFESGKEISKTLILDV